jgi:hypothetical protein
VAIAFLPDALILFSVQPTIGAAVALQGPGSEFLFAIAGGKVYANGGSMQLHRASRCDRLAPEMHRSTETRR